MLFSQFKLLTAGSALIVVSLLTRCKHEEVDVRAPLNSFSMQVNGQIWVPFQAKDDPCTSTYTSVYATYGEIPLYSIYAYRDLNGVADAYSDNLLRVRIMNVTEPGIYLLDGTYKEDFNSYFIFVMQQITGNAKRYVNDPHRSSFVVNIQEFIPIKSLTTKGIKGSFAGVLYNEAAPSDSLIIEKGEFTFKLVGVNYDGHCDD